MSAPKLDMAALMARKASRCRDFDKAALKGLLKRSQGGADRGPWRRWLPSKAVRVGDQTLEGDNILIATGSKPAVPPIPGIDSKFVLDSTSVLDLSQLLPERLAIIGGGYIGLEFASFFAEVGVEVVVVEMLPQVAAGCDGDVSKRLLQAVRKSGVDVQLSSKVTGIEGKDLHYEAQGRLAGEGVRRTYILNATGRAPVLDGLGLDAAGVDYSRKGIRTTDQGKTNVPGVWACGDCHRQDVNWPMRPRARGLWR